MQDKQSGGWSRADTSSQGAGLVQIQAFRGLVSYKTSSQGAGLVQDKQSGCLSSARQAVRGMVSCKTSSQGAGLVQIQAVRGLVPCKISSHNAGLVQDKHGLVQDKQSGGWSRARQAVRRLV